MRGPATFAACLGLVAALAAPAQATFPGQNGKLAITQFSGILSVATVNPDGTGLTQLTEEETSVGPAWSPDGERIAYRRHVVSGTHIYVMDADGANRRLVYDTDNVVFEVTWSPDGEHLTFAAGPTYGGDHNIWILDIDTGVAQKFFDPPSPELADDPDWSPDGERLALTLSRLEMICDDLDPEIADCFPMYFADIHVLNRDGSGLRRLTTSGGEAPSWSPDGGRIAYSTSNGNVHVVNVDGTGHTVLGSGVAPAWSPDGTKIGFGLPDADVYLMDPDGSNRVRILDGSLQTGATAYSAPVWQAIPNAPPDCSGVRADPGVLWPPNNKLRTVTLSGATDPDGDTVTLVVTRVTQDESAGREADSLIGSGETVLLRADRDPKGDGRVYTVAFRVTDERGASCTGTAAVSVPRHKGS